MDRGGYEYISPQVNLNITFSGVTNGTVVRAVGVFKKTLNGIWRLEFNIHATHDVDADYTIAITGIVGVNGIRQAISFSQGTTATVIYEFAYLDGNSGNIVIRLGANTATTFLSGNVELGTKPTAYLPDGV